MSRGPQLALVLVLGTSVLAACGAAGVDPPPGPDPSRDLLAELAEACDLDVAPDQACLTDRYSSLDGVEDLLAGIEVGPGGLEEMTAGPEGLAAGVAAVGLSLPNVVSTLDIAAPSVTLHETADCRFLWEPATWLGMSVDPDDAVAGFYIASPVVRTAEGIGVGSSLADVQAAYAVTVERADTFAVAYTATSVVDGAVGDPRRSMVFETGGPDDLVTAWRVGIPDYVQTGGMCP